MIKIKNILFGVSAKASIQNTGLLLMRLSLSCLMFTHGFAKLSHFSEISSTFFNPLGIGSKMALIMILFAEIGCSALVLLGLFTRLATIPVIFGMIVAALFAHSGAPFAEIELAIFYLLMFLVLLFLGPGKYSIDAFIQNFLSKKNK